MSKKQADTNTAKGLSRSEQMRVSSRARKRRQRKREAFLVLALLVIVGAVIGVLMVTVLFKADKIVVENAAVRYSDEDIIKASGIEKGGSMLGFSQSAVAESIEKKLPYIGKVTVTRQFPDTVHIKTEYAKAYFAVDGSGGWVMMSSAGKVLESGVRELPENIGVAYGITLSSVVPGLKATPNDSDAFDGLTKLAATMEECGYTNVTAYDLTDLNQVKIEIDHAITVKLGGITDAPEKLSFGKAVIDKNINASFDGMLVIDLTEKDTAYVRPQSAIDAQERDEETTAQGETAANVEASENAGENTLPPVG